MSAWIRLAYGVLAVMILCGLGMFIAALVVFATTPDADPLPFSFWLLITVSIPLMVWPIMIDAWWLDARAAAVPGEPR